MHATRCFCLCCCCCNPNVLKNATLMLFPGPLRGTGKFPPSPAWHRNQKRLRARARVAARSGLASETQALRLQKHHSSTVPKTMTWYGGAGNSSWCAGCRSWKWEGGTRCHCKTKKGVKKAQSDGNLLDSSAMLAHASRADFWWLRRTQR